MSTRSPYVLALGACLALACRTPGPAEPSDESPRESAAAAAAPAAEAAIEAGLRASAPLPHGSRVELASVRVELQDVKRGAAAWQALRAASAANRPAREGTEFLLVRLKLGAKDRASWIGCKDFRAAGMQRVVYFHGSEIAPKPELANQTLEPGESAEGWCVYPIRTGDRGLLLMLNEPDSRDPAGLRYLALEEGAALADPAGALEAPSSAAGASRAQAAPPGRGVATKDWHVKAVEILRGDAARRLVESANERNAGPDEGLEFVAVKLQARYLGHSGQPGLLSASQFQSIAGDGRPYARAIVLDLSPGLSRTLLPGGEHTGWAVFQVAPGDARAVLRFAPLYPDEGERFLALAGG